MSSMGSPMGRRTGGRACLDAHRGRIQLLVRHQGLVEVDEAEIGHAARAPAVGRLLQLGVVLGAHAHQQPAHHVRRIAIEAVGKVLRDADLLRLAD
jgi:hypothetical protein